MCFCERNYQGDNCEFEKSELCKNIDCYNGICKDDGMTAVCECYEGFGGQACEGILKYELNSVTVYDRMKRQDNSLDALDDLTFNENVTTDT